MDLLVKPASEKRNVLSSPDINIASTGYRNNTQKKSFKDKEIIKIPTLECLLGLKAACTIVTVSLNVRLSLYIFDG